MEPTSDVREAVREKYGSLAEGRSSGCGCGCGKESRQAGAAASGTAAECCGGPGSEDVLLRLGYSAEQAAAVPEGANLGLGCGNPLAHARIRPGETVLDLGSGAGIDVFLAARDAGPAGRAIGVDMTAAMVERARANARHTGVANAEFRLGEIEHLPVADASVDVVISNCVINLSPQKAQVFREAHRVLRPGGRMVVSDLVLLRPLPPEMRGSLDAYVGCIAGAALRPDYLRMIREAGFLDVEVVEESRYAVGEDALEERSPLREAMTSVVSLEVHARKP